MNPGTQFWAGCLVAVWFIAIMAHATLLIVALSLWTVGLVLFFAWERLHVPTERVARFFGKAAVVMWVAYLLQFTLTEGWGWLA